MAATEQHLRSLLRAGAEEQREYRQQFIRLKKKLLESEGVSWQIREGITGASDMVGLCKIFATDFDFKRLLVRQLNITGDFDILKKAVRPSG
ncbi:hypothetical protein Psal006b_00592 [Piscirickettsia salmonis]|uniref:tRNA modifying enzyme MiaB n=1 Tax=Piscirickettsia salmonis TaxID=1238 RepID=A0A1L6TEF8_PISSA|nr:hypothetical protein [Piscirickettsia salmonis]ALB23776.1 tRNA modifying enzyme MiaB [Piscirickettsia salmonis]ALT18661.1 hypothetical protein PSLF89_07445 [Piscirickettsia salmonis LF-89 = ATCC VR-1361]ALY03623.1 hypothetical protein AWE47_12820 [Piscirickettsia salmonis]AMA43187.1 hypothetical protein AWJ11_13050 [Piscirickettsia salmonis]AOS35659.1 hypothetical protein AVM72_10175 [Piscirickettsia salmonis]